MHEWDIDNKNLVLLGLEQDDTKELNKHALPIKHEYEFYDDLYLLYLNNNKLIDLDEELFENIYNALFLNVSDSEESDLSDDLSEELDIPDIDDLEEIEDYGDEELEDDYYLSDDNIETEKKPKKIISIKNNNDILYKEENVKELKNQIRIEIVKILKTLFTNKELDNKLIKYINEVEKEIYNYSITKCINLNIVPTWNILFKKIYVNKCRSIFSNLQPNNYIKNKRLKKDY